MDRLLSNLAICSFETRDEQEVAGYDELMEPVFASYYTCTERASHPENHASSYDVITREECFMKT